MFVSKEWMPDFLTNDKIMQLVKKYYLDMTRIYPKVF